MRSCSTAAAGPCGSPTTATAARADLKVALAVDTLHLLLMDELSIKKAMGAGLIRVKGPAWKLPVLFDVIQAGRRFYPEAVRHQPPSN